MHTMIEDQIQSVKEICVKHYVKKLWVFGSVLHDNFHFESDIDLLYELEEDRIEENEYLTNLFSWVEELETLLDRKIDLTWYPGIKNPYFKEEVDETKVLIYDSEGEKVSV